ncbi:MAG TPA: translation initiation factor [Chitinophagaceae bacterium]|jgi:translation initiation factor 1|nr:translation initiation factor [Chitinophagaceae bacterium]
MRKKKSYLGGIIYSTDSSLLSNNSEEEIITLTPEDQSLKVILDTKQRAGKAVTLVTGFIGSTADVDKLSKILKTYCGTGGSVKDGIIIIQGDQREKVKQWLLKSGYKKTN